MAQLDSGKFNLDSQRHSIEDALKPARQDAHASPENHPVQLQLAPGLPNVPMDVARIREVLMHLLENAGKYSPAGAPVKVTSEIQHERAVTSVADLGPELIRSSRI